MSGPDCPKDWTPFLEGGLPQATRDAWESHLYRCPECARRCQRDREMIELLRRPDPSLANRDLVGPLHTRLTEPPAPARRGIAWKLAFASVAAAGVATILVLRLWPTDGIRAKSGGDNQAERWTGVRVFQVDGAGAAVPLEPGASPKGDFAFTYVNGAKPPWKHLMVFAVDSVKQIHWFYPAYTDPSADPESVVIEAGPEERELSERIHIHAAPGRLRIVALFTHEALRVSRVEEWVRRSLAENTFWRDGRLPLPDAYEQILDFSVRP
ncbi:MAG: hypothetical protein GYA21_18050 [Myxococcales bacterium]|nr:hypothetical protein [Myxococcales bacterium]